MVRKIKYIGIDFGSSKTEIAGVDEEGNVYVIPCNDAEDSFFSALAESKTRSGEDDLYFVEARAKAGREDYDYYDALKEGLAHEYGAEERAEKFFKRLYETILKVADNSEANGNDGTMRPKIESDTFDFSEIKSITFGQPAYYQPDVPDIYCERMTNIIAKTFAIDKNNVHGCAEPVLEGLAYHYIARPEFKKGDVVFVLDFGGHTMDLVLLEAITEKRGGKEEICLTEVSVPESFYGYVPMGKYISSQLCGKIYRTNSRIFDYEIERKKCEFLSNYKDSRSVGSAEGTIMYSDKLQAWGEDRPKRFKIEKKKTCQVSEGSGGKTVHVDMSDIGFDAILSDIESLVLSYLDGCESEDGAITYVLFSGGTSKIPILRETVIKKLSDSGAYFVAKTMDDDHQGAVQIKRAFYGQSICLSSKNAVAIGAALEAAGLVTCNRTETGKRRSDSSKMGRLKKNVTELTNQLKIMQKCCQAAKSAVRREEQKYQALCELIETKYPAIAAELFRENGGGNT